MKRLLLTAVLSSLAFAPSLAAAQLTLGARVAAAFPLGDEEKGAPLSDALSHAFPLELRVGWRLDPSLEVGLQGGYGFASVASASERMCAQTGTACSAHLWRLAARGEYSTRRGDWRPFTAATLGWEWEVRRWEATSDNWSETTRSGWELGGEAGIDRVFQRGFEAGIFAGLSLAQFRSKSVEQKYVGYTTHDAGSIQNPPLHGWFTIGLRGTFAL